MYQPEGYYVIKCRLTWAQLDEILGKSEYGLQHEENPQSYQPCGLSSANTITYKIYCNWIEGIGSESAHVVLHPDGVCFSGSLGVEQDWSFAKELFNRVRNRLEQFQSVVAGVYSEIKSKEV